MIPHGCSSWKRLWEQKRWKSFPVFFGIVLELDADETVRHDPGKAKALDNVFEDSGIGGVWGYFLGFIFWGLFLLSWTDPKSPPSHLVIKSWMQEQLQEHPCASLQSQSSPTPCPAPSVFLTGDIPESRWITAALELEEPPPSLGSPGSQLPTDLFPQLGFEPLCCP